MSTTAGCDPGSVCTVFVAVVFWPQEHGLEEPVLRSWDFTEFLTTVQHPFQPLNGRSTIRVLTVAQVA